MALQVWLPLNGDLHNLGLSKVTIINNGATINNSGKIGKCYLFGTSTSYLTISKEAMTSFTTECSVSLWLNILTWNTSYATYFLAGTGSTPWNNYIFGLLRNNANSTLCFTISNGSSASNNSYLTPTLELNKWYHITLVYKTGHCLIYINGNLLLDYTTSIVPDFTKITTITTGIANSKANYQTNCLMNDLRIYDHALSVKEIKELAKGLILHYPLNNNGLGFNWLKNSYIERTITRASGNTFIDYEYYSDLITCTDTIYTVRFKAKGSVTGMKLDIYFRDSGGGSYAITSTLTLTTSWNTYILTINGSPENILKFRVRCYGGTAGDIIYIKNLRLFSDNMPLRENIIYDSSGYNHNGIITGAITIENGNQKYNKNIHMSATSQYIKISGLNTTGFSNSYSFAWWGKIDTYSGKMFWGFSDGVRLNGIYNGNLWNTGDSASNPLYNPGTTTQVTAPSGNTWEYWVMTGNGTKCYVYRNGVLWGEAKTYKTITGTTIYINGWDTGVNYKSTNMSISDFRIYATALSADDVLELYKLSKIINNGNILPRSLD